MSLNYATPLPLDKNGESMQQYPAAIVGKVSWRATTAASSVVILGHDTTVLEVGAIGGQGVLIKWISSTFGYNSSVISSGIGVANFDHCVPINTVRRFVVPIETVGNPTSVQGINRATGLYQAVGWVAVNASSSVVAIEY